MDRIILLKQEAKPRKRHRIQKRRDPTPGRVKGVSRMIGREIPEQKLQQASGGWRTPGKRSPRKGKK